MKPNVCTSSTFPWRGEERNLSYTWRWWKEGGKREKSWRNGGEWSLAEMWKRNGEGDERKVRENEMKREKKLSQMKLVRV